MTFTTVPAEWRASVEDLVAEHAWVLDRGDPRKLPDLYEPSGELIGLGEPLVGRAALERWAEHRAGIQRISRHVHTNLRLWIDSAGQVRGNLLTLLYRYDGSATGPVGPTWPALVLDYDDVYAINGDRCRFQRREITRVFVDTERVPT